MPDHEQIYANEASAYELLISREDMEGNLARALQGIRAFEGLDVLDLGAGTGRLSCMLAPIAGSVVAVDASRAMLDVAESKLKALGCTNWRTVVSDHRALAVADQSADVIVAGWTLCYLASSNTKAWRRQLEWAWDEMGRVLRPGGTVIIVETLGTGAETPAAPQFLQSYYRVLQEHYGLEHQWLRTDFRFESAGEAERLTRFFFGDALADRVASESANELPECTGIWHKHNFREAFYDTRGGGKG